MSFVWGAVALAVALGAEIALGAWLPSAHRYIDVMMLPVIGYALRKSQRAAMVLGCLGGLMEDAWFQSGLFGSSGFAKTLLGWALGGAGTRFELDVAWGRAASGALLPLAERLVVLGLGWLFAVPSGSTDAVQLGVRAVAGSLLTVAVFAMLDRVTERDGRRSRRAPSRLR